MTFDVGSPKSGKPVGEQTVIQCRSCNDSSAISSLEMEQTKFFNGKEERAELRCQSCGVVVMEVWNDRSGGPVGDDKDQMTHNQFADLLSDLQDNLKNVMTDDEVESFSNEIEELEEKVRT